MERRLQWDLVPRVYSTQPDAPEDGRTFVWSRMGWFERDEGPTGDVAFEPVAESEHQLKEWLSAQSEPAMEELDNEFAASVRAEFLEQSPLFPEDPGLPDEPPGEDVGIKSPFMHYVDEEEGERVPEE